MERNYTIDTLRTVATLLVILLHVTSEYVAKGVSNNDYNLSFWIGNILDSFSRISVPLFVLISGMFLVGRKDSFQEFYKKRISRILIPLVVWTIIYLVVRGIFNYVSYDAIRLKSILDDLLMGTPFYHMWYMYMIIGLYLFTPVLNNSISLLSRKNLWYVSISLLIFGVVNMGYDHYRGNEISFALWFVNYLGYFIIGFLIKDSKKNIPTILLLAIYIFCSLVISILSFYTAKLFANLYFYGYLTPFVIIASISIYKLFHQIHLRPNVLSKISHLTLGIFLVHAGILEGIVVGLQQLNIHLFDNPIIGIPFKFTLTLIISIMIVNIFFNSKFLKKII